MLQGVLPLPHLKPSLGLLFLSGGKKKKMKMEQRKYNKRGEVRKKDKEERE